MSAEHVVLLHGLARSANAMEKLAQAARRDGFVVSNLDYPSTTAPIEELVDRHLTPLVDQIQEKTAPGQIHFVGHSMGGILIRHYLARHGPRLSALGRVVMLGTPNRGSELVDRLGNLAPFGWINGPAGQQLGTDPGSLPNRLGPVDYPVGIIAGTRSWNPLYSSLIPGEDDGKVSVRSAQVEGQKDVLILPVNHTFMMKNDEVIHRTLRFLREGKFARQGRQASPAPNASIKNAEPEQVRPPSDHSD